MNTTYNTRAKLFVARSHHLIARTVITMLAGACLFVAEPGTGFAAPNPGNPPATTKVDGPRLVIPNTSLSASNIPGGQLANYTFEVRNEGTQDLKIEDVHPGCGCTVASFDPVIPPGGKGAIKASIQTQALWGKVVKYMTVTTNDPANRTVTLILNAEVIPAVTITPQEFISVQYDDPGPITQVFTLQSHRKEPMNPAKPATSGPIVAKGEPDSKSPDIYHVTVTITPPASGGDARGEVVLDTGLPGVPTVHLTLTAVGLRGITTSTPVINLGLVTGTGNGAGQPVKGTVALFSRKSSFHITRIETDDSLLKVQYEEVVSPTGFYSVILTYPGGWKKGIHEGSLTIYTDLPAVPSIKMPYWASVQ